MASRVETYSTHYSSKIRSVNIRELIILSLGLADKQITSRELYTITKNLAVRIRSHVKFRLPQQEIFERLIQKLIKQRIITTTYSLSRKKYILGLSEMGLGEYDGLLMSILNPQIAVTFEEFKELIQYTH